MSESASLLRERMVRKLATEHGIDDPAVLAALRAVPRHLFVPEHYRSKAYGNYRLPIGVEQTISQPYIVAKMSQLLAVEKQHKVLEIGTGSGYQTAILAHLARQVFSLERHAELARGAIRRIRELGLDNVKIQIFDGSVGWGEAGPYDRILVTAAAPSVPKPLLGQLARNGKLLLPEGDRERQRLVLYSRRPGSIQRRVGEEVSFVPLVGRHGWQAGEA